MKALIFTIVTAIILLACLFLVALIPFAYGQATTEFSGLITTNMTWTKQQSPFLFTGPVTIVNGATLTIQPGVSIILGSTYTLTVNGALFARGTPTDPIRFTGGSTSGFGPIIFNSVSSSWNEQTATGCIVENSILTASGIDIENASPKINNCTLSSSGIVINAASQGTPIISNNTIKGTGAIPSVGISCGGNAIITGNNITGLQTGLEIFLGNAIVTNNVIWNNSQSIPGGEGVSIKYRSDFGVLTSPTLSNNTIVYNSMGINLVGRPTPKIYYNNIQENTNYNINLYNGTVLYYPKGGNVNATLNWWGTSNTAAINRTIYDWKNNANLGNVTFAPFLNASNSLAPPVPTPGIYIPEFQGSPAIVSTVILITLAAVATGSILLRGRKPEKATHKLPRC
jgi:parallel beta-helix repeat protein